MKRYLLLLFPIFLAAFSTIDLKPVDGDGSVTFVIKNFGVNTKGEFKGLKGIIKWDAANPENSSFNVSVDVNTINTGIDMRDNDLKKESYFNAEKYPTISFVSTAVSAGNVTGNITIKGVTSEISIPFTATPDGNGYLFEGKFLLNRKDFGVGGGSFVLSDHVDVTLKVHTQP
ncbi:MAG TPA: YceI family protein [Chitinophagaceae bacterium]